MSLPVGRYKGRTRIRPGRESELTKQELSKLKKGVDEIDLELKPDGKFVWKKATEGAYQISGNKVLFTVETFGGQSLQQMRDRAEEMNRTFGLSFLFNPFELVIEGDRLVTPEESSVFYVEYVLNRP